MFTIHVGFSGFPYGMASVQRTLLTFKGLKAAGSRTLLINKISHHQYADNKKVKKFEGLLYVNTAWYNSRPDSFAKRNFNKISGYIGEFFFFFKKRKKIGTAILYSNYFLEYPYYFLLSRIFGFKLVVQYVEMFSAIPGRNSFFTKINDKFIDRYISRFCDGVIAISDYLLLHIKKISPKKPVIKIPVLADFDKINAIAIPVSKPYIMYCGTIYYFEVIDFIMSVFTLLKENKKYQDGLLLIISGDHDSNRQKLDSLILDSKFKDDIVIKSNIAHDELLSAYAEAEVLLIPLRNTIQDIARFPHKIGEYTAAKRPIVSTNIGEIKTYFKDNESAILAENYSIEGYYNKLVGGLSSSAKMNKIGEAGYSIGLKNFEYLTQGKEIKKFIDRLSRSA
jgi:glycosyltransferase involved in cell wall biosynthesis